MTSVSDLGIEMLAVSLQCRCVDRTAMTSTSPNVEDLNAGEPLTAEGRGSQERNLPAGAASSDPYRGVPLGVECAWWPDAIAGRLEHTPL
jgi:hypothetical protein